MYIYTYMTIYTQSFYPSAHKQLIRPLFEAKHCYLLFFVLLDNNDLAEYKDSYVIAGDFQFKQV